MVSAARWNPSAMIPLLQQAVETPLLYCKSVGLSGSSCITQALHICVALHTVQGQGLSTVPGWDAAIRSAPNIPALCAAVFYCTEMQLHQLTATELSPSSLRLFPVNYTILLELHNLQYFIIVRAIPQRAIKSSF